MQYPIDHPAQEGWTVESRSELNSYQRELLTQRYQETEIEVPELIAAVESVTRYVNHRRHIYEDTALSTMGIGRDCREEYRRMAGKPSQLVDFLQWFGKKEQKYREEHGDRAHKLGLEIFTIIQGGDLDSTGKIDTPMKDLPARTKGIDYLGFELSGGPINYRYQPRWGSAYGIIRRRRGVANTRYCHIFKEATGLVVLQELPVEERNAIITDLKTEEGRKDNTFDGGKNDTLAAIAAAMGFKRVIKRNDPSVFTQVVPIAAQYIVKANKSNRH